MAKKMRRIICEEDNRIEINEYLFFFISILEWIYSFALILIVILLIANSINSYIIHPLFDVATYSFRNLLIAFGIDVSALIVNTILITLFQPKGKMTEWINEKIDY